MSGNGQAFSVFISCVAVYVFAAEKQRLREEGAALILQGAYRCRLARRKVAKLRGLTPSCPVFCSFVQTGIVLKCS